MADLAGIIPALPSGGQMSQRQQYGANGQAGYNIIPFDPNAANQGIYNQTGQVGRYNAPGYLYGYGDIANDPKAQAALQFSNKLTPYVAGGKIIPSQYTMTAAQSVGPAQFQMGNQTATAGSGNQSSPFTATAATPAQQAPDPSANQPFLFGYNGSAGKVQGTFGNTQAGQSSPFYQSQTPGPFAMGSPPNLGKVQPLTPQQQALIQSR